MHIKCINNSLIIPSLIIIIIIIIIIIRNWVLCSINNFTVIILQFTDCLGWNINKSVVNLFYEFILVSIININTLMIFWLILGQKKTSLVIFLWKRRTSLLSFWPQFCLLLLLLLLKYTCEHNFQSLAMRL